tara:strand:+ start:5437 stop:6621 length:1185 start_codon:yes stop_codon:yes gene_type:complete
MNQITEKTTKMKNLKPEKSENADSFRSKYAKLYKTLELPKERQEEWRYTHLTKLSIDNFDFSDLPTIQITDLPNSLKEKGIILTDINTASSQHQELIQKHFFKNISPDFDKFTALNASSFQNGFFLYIPKNTTLEIPINIKFLIKNSIYHNIIIIEENSTLNINEELLDNSTSETFHNSITEIYAKENSRINYYNLRNLKNSTYSFSHKIAKLSKDANINWYTACFSGKLNRLRIDTHFTQPSAESKNIGLFLGKDSEQIDITTNVYHDSTNTTNDIKFDGILKDSSKSIYRGLITITEKGQHTNSYLSNKILKIGEKSLANSIPALKIDANEVKASHGATIGQVNEEHLFYLMSRGLSRKQAEQLIIQGFLEPTIGLFQNQEFKEKIRKIIKN